MKMMHMQLPTCFEIDMKNVFSLPLALAFEISLDQITNNKKKTE